MPVRSKGRLLAGAGAVLALCVNGPGCQTGQIRPAAIASSAPVVVADAPPSAAVVAAAPAPAWRFSFFRGPAAGEDVPAAPVTAVAAGTPAAPVTAVAAATPAAAPAVAAAPARPRRFSFFRRTKPAVEMQAPVTKTDAARGMDLIASTWQPIDRTPPAPTVQAPAAPAAPADAALQQTGAKASAAPDDSPWRPSVVAASAQAGPALPADAPPGPAVPPADTPPAPRLVPQPAPVAHAPVLIPPPAHPHARYHYPSGVEVAAPVPALMPPVPREFEKQSLPPYVVEPPDILLIQASPAITLPTQPLSGQHLVRPDGTINLGIYGSVFVAGLTLDQVRDVVASVLKARHLRRIGEDKKPTGEELTVEQIKLELQVDVLAYNSKVYYVITDGGGYGEQVYRISATGNETVLDALSQINGLPAVASKKKIWVARATPDHAPPVILPVDWCGIVRDGSAATNYQIFPGDRVYVNSDPLIRTDSRLSKILSPIDRVFGSILLGSSAVNSIRNGGNGGSGGGVP